MKLALSPEMTTGYFPVGEADLILSRTAPMLKLAEAITLEQSGVDIVVAQGWEAGVIAGVLK